MAGVVAASTSVSRIWSGEAGMGVVLAQGQGDPALVEKMLGIAGQQARNQGEDSIFIVALVQQQPHSAWMSLLLHGVCKVKPC
jgi:hypothetical protein